VIDELELKRFGYAIFPKDPASFTPLPDGRSLLFWQDQKKTFDEIAKFSRHDAEQYPIYEELVSRLAVFAESQFRRTPANLFPTALDDWQRMIVLGGELLRLGWSDLAGLTKVLRRSVLSFLDDYFQSEVVKATLATDGVIGFNGGPSTPGSAYVLLHHCMGEVGGKRGLWGFVKGGMGGITQALRKSAESKGVAIQTREWLFRPTRPWQRSGPIPAGPWEWSLVTERR
jgi:phytoene dehydrogenase-like protein